MRGWPATVLWTCLVLVAGSCAKSAEPAGAPSAASAEAPSSTVPLDGTPRLPDAEGIVIEMTRSELTLDGGRTYPVSRRLQSFSTQTGQLVPALGREGQYVHVGIEGGTVVWFAPIAEVFEGEVPVAYYTGQLDRIVDGRARFRDGTVLRLADGVAASPGPGIVQVEIDPVARVVRRVSRP